MRKFALLAAATALTLSGPVLAQDNQDKATASVAEKGANELEAFTKFFENMFPKDDTPIAPELLEKGERVAGAIVPTGSYRKIMAGTFQQIIEPMMAGMDDIPLSTIAAFAGVSEEDITLKEGATLSDLMIIVDPYYKQRNRAMMAQITDILIDMSDDMEPPIRTGLARAYARRFSANELEAAAQFYETDSGAKIAGESLAIFASPEVMSASMEMMPKFMERLMGVIGEIAEGSGDLPPRRSFGDLSEDELDTMAELMGVDRESMAEARDDHSYEMTSGAAEVAAEEAAAAAVAAVDAACEADEECHSEADEARWADPKNWSAAERDTVAELEAKHEAAFDKFFAAQEAAYQNAKKRLKKD
ncbi:DUF2059 domain-containing protein [Parasphingorhabdus sp.]|uniref:DUF2059 domain-containing protein n=1 Tax=Parasphingorhabdus sp. TaxID=2709688 RepID=UPI003C7967C2